MKSVAYVVWSNQPQAQAPISGIETGLQHGQQGNGDVFHGVLTTRDLMAVLALQPICPVSGDRRGVTGAEQRLFEDRAV